MAKRERNRAADLAEATITCTGRRQMQAAKGWTTKHIKHEQHMNIMSGPRKTTTDRRGGTTQSEQRMEPSDWDQREDSGVVGFSSLVGFAYYTILLRSRWKQRYCVWTGEGV